jgi:photosystem II stability/assembly factor-like uncharacterized protein
MKLLYGGANDDLVSRKVNGWVNCGSQLDQFDVFHFIDTFYGFASSNIPNCDIIATEDGGATWETRFEYDSNFRYPQHICMTSRTSGVIVGQGEMIAVTNDGWHTVNQIQPYTIGLQAYMWVDMLQSSPLCGWLVGGGATGTIIKYTSDGGLTWVAQVAPVANKIVTRVSAASTTKAVCGTNAGLGFYKTGAAWASSTFIPALTTSYQCVGMKMFTVTSGLCVYNNGATVRVYQTADGGVNWTQIVGQTSPTLLDVFDTCIIDATTIYLVGFSNKLFVTTNAGVTWTAQTGDAYGSRIQMIGNYGWMSNSSGYMITTTTGGYAGYGFAVGNIYREYLDQSVKVDSHPTFVGLTLDDLTLKTLHVVNNDNDPEVVRLDINVTGAMASSAGIYGLTYLTNTSAVVQAYGFYAGLLDYSIIDGLSYIRSAQYNNMTWGGVITNAANVDYTGLTNYISTNASSITGDGDCAVSLICGNNENLCYTYVDKSSGNLDLLIAGSRGYANYDTSNWAAAGGSPVLVGCIGIAQIDDFMGFGIGLGGDFYASGGLVAYGVRASGSGAITNYSFYATDGDWAAAADNMKFYFGSALASWITFDGTDLHISPNNELVIDGAGGVNADHYSVGLSSGLGGQFLSADGQLLTHIGGIIVASDAQTMWDDLRVPANVTTGGATAPTWGTFLGTTRILWFAPSGPEESVDFCVQMPHGWNAGSIHPHIHWTPKTTADGAPANQTVSWGLEYTWIEHGKVFGAPITVYTNVHDPADANVVASKHYKSYFASIAASGDQDGLSSMLVCRVFRNTVDAGGSTDNYEHDAGLLEIDFHFEMDATGSHLEDTK